MRPSNIVCQRPALKNHPTHAVVNLGRFPRIGSLPLVLLFLGALLYLAFILLVPQAPPRPDAAWTRIQREGVVRIGIDPSSPPFIVDDGTGKLSGFDVALANELAGAWGVQVQYVYTGYDGLYDALNAKQFDLILSALPYNPNRTQEVFYSTPYFNGGPVLVARGDDPSITRLEDLEKRTIAVELGSNGDAVARRWQKRYNLNLQQFNTAFDALRALQARQVNAAIVDPISFIDFQRAEADTGALNWRSVGRPLADENYVIAVRRDTPTLLQEVNRVIETLRQSGELEQMEQENF
jgi:ABC-type amino acid transport substrate-binding protein